jgi:hypothetical protein
MFLQFKQAQPVFNEQRMNEESEWTIQINFNIYATETSEMYNIWELH